MGQEIRPGYKQTEVGVIPEDWDCVSVGEVAVRKANAIVGGPFGSDLVSADYVPFGVPVIRGQNMSGMLVAGDFVYVSDEKAKALKANTAAPGDLVFTQRGTLGQVCRVPVGRFDCYLVSQSQMKLSPNIDRFDSDFLLQFFHSEFGQRKILDSAIQTGVPHTNLGILRSYRLPAPQLQEQRAIAAALADADALIAALEGMIAKKRDLKQAAMQHLLTGKTRLPGFSGEWEVKRLGDVLTVRHGKSQKDVERTGGTYPIFATGGEIGRSDVFLYDKPSVLIGRKGTIDEPRYVDTPFWTIDTLFYTEISARAVPLFVYYKFLTIDWRSYNEASGVPSLSSKTIEKIEIGCPDPAEQAAIAEVLSDMDADIAALEAQAAKARAVKQGMMQELLTGRVRLV